ncbi:radical SAM family heme chaperone HemW [Alkaliphilus serpentinus]|uniref:Heme chaperone HemW n=1 Tax=Alkaliphilus serpentinus TaxID=1482731 RepID=A0A833M8E7_9FIRM|nr:radical SAM family heme chaperone HemW [Alkaliphilus serpentinus]KAB3530741.1 oxygen-independent coproporphyrinogen III oxidase [Alkaliphilus serpentinus]
MDPIGLYIHFPFCQRKCNYCDFNSFSGKHHHIEAYLKGLIQEISLYSREVNKRPVKSIFIGGGTPSLMEAKQANDLLVAIDKAFNLQPDIEITLEGNPGTLNSEKLNGYRRAGINRLSMGLQACQQGLLEKLGRIHTYQDFIRNLQEARRQGFENINVDLMMGLPGQYLKDWQWTLEEITALDIPHISAYSLIWEEGTSFHKLLMENQLQQMEEGLELEMFHYTMSFLREKGYEHYEISNYALEGYRCKHNIIYWKNQNYLGLGAGAHSCINGRRFSNEANLEAYIKKVHRGENIIIEDMILTREDEISETMFLGLRMLEGINQDDFVKRFGKSPVDIYGRVLTDLEKRGLLELSKERVKLTPKGLDLGNLVFSEMIIDQSSEK